MKYSYMLLKNYNGNKINLLKWKKYLKFQKENSYCTSISPNGKIKISYRKLQKEIVTN